MDPLDLQPWLEDCLEALEPRRGERLLQVGSRPSGLTAALRQTTGEDGRVLVLEADRARAEQIAADEVPGVQVVHARLDPPPALGRHDALIGLFEHSPPEAATAALVHRNLRPGGRFVLDLPSPRPCEAFVAAWLRASGDLEQIENWTGVGPESLSMQLKEQGLRGVETFEATYLLRTETAHALAEWLLARVDRATAESEAGQGLAIALAERAGSAGPSETVVHRTRACGFF